MKGQFARRYLLTLLLVLIASAARAVPGTESVQARGYGEDPQHAVANALVEAVRQAGGVTLAVNPDFRRRVDHWVMHRHGDASTWIGTATSVADPRLPTLGSLANYKVTDVSRVDNSLWRADVRARVMRTKPLGPDRSNLPTIVVAPFATQAAHYQLGSVTVNATEARRRLRADLVEALTQSGRFQVLDRAHLAARDRELKVIANGSTDPAALVKLGKSRGADVILVGRIESFDIGDNSRRYYGSRVHDYRPHVRVRYRLIDVATGEILAADLFTWRQSGADIRALARQQNIDDWNHPERLADVVYPRIARAIAADATDTLYPVRVLKVSDGRVYLSQGRGRLAKGDRFQVMGKAGTAKDPDTGRRIRLAGPALATVEVERVRADYGIARVVAGQGPVKRGDRLRRAAPREAPPPPRPVPPDSSSKPVQWNR